MSKKNNLASALSNIGAQLETMPPVPRREPVAPLAPVPLTPRQKQATTHPRRVASNLKSITVYYPESVRRQLKTLAFEQERDMDDLVAEALNLVFAKYRKPEIAPRKTGDH